MKLNHIKREYCQTCHRPLKVCLCAYIKDIDLPHRVIILRDVSEKGHALNTANLLKLMLTNCEVYTEKEFDECFINAIISDSNYQSLLVYPETQTEGISVAPKMIESSLPKQLIFLDGTWKKAKKILLLSPSLQSIPRLELKISEDQKSQYKIRKQISGGLSTLEAAAKALESFDTPQAQTNALYDIFNAMIEKQIELMGKDTFKNNYKS